MKAPRLFARPRFWLVFIPALFFFTMKTHRTFSGSGDEPHYILIAESLLDDHDLNVANQYPDRHTFVPQIDLDGIHAVPKKGGGYFPSHDIGLPVLMLPLLAIAHGVVPRMPASWLRACRLNPEKMTVALFSYQSIAVSCVICLLLNVYFLRLGFSARFSFLGALGALLSAPMMTHATLFFTEIYSTCAVLIAAILLLGEPDRRSSLQMALTVFVLSWLHIKNQMLAAAIGLLWLRHSRRAGLGWTSLNAGWPLLAFGMTVILRALVQHAALGQWMPNARYERMHFQWIFIPKGLSGLFFDREFGLLFVNPLFVLLPAGLVVCWRLHRQWLGDVAFMLVAYCGTILPFSIWWAGWSPAARHLLPVVPLLWVPVLQALRASWQVARTLGRLSLLLLGSGAAAVSLIFWQHPMWSWSFADGNNRWMTALSPGCDWQTLLPTFFTEAPDRHLVLGAWIGFTLMLNLWVLAKVWHATERTTLHA